MISLWVYRIRNALAVAELYCQAAGDPFRREVIRREIANEYFVWG